MISTACIFEVWTTYRSCLDNDDETDFWNVKNTSSDNLTNVSKKLCQKYHNFFNIWNADQLASHWVTDHAIDLKLNIKLSYMHTYNMFSAELKTLNNYLNDILIKKWIHKFQSFADTLILFISWKSEKLHLYVDYHELNVIIIKNHYLLALTSELLDWLSSSTVFSKINLQNIYHKIHICQNNE